MAANHSDVSSGGFRKVIQGLLIMLVAASHDQTIRIVIDVESAQSAVNLADNKPFRGREAIGITVLLTIIDDPHIEVASGRKVSDSLPDMPCPDNQQPTASQMR